MSAEHDPSTPRAGASDGPPPAPRWVKALVVAVVVLIALAILIMLLSGGNHGPGRHMSPDSTTSQLGSLSSLP